MTFFDDDVTVVRRVVIEFKDGREFVGEDDFNEGDDQTEEGAKTT